MHRKECLDYMYGISRYYNLLPETLALAIALFDSCYTLVAPLGFDTKIYRAACLSVASKYEETVPPSFKQLGLHIYEHDEMTKAELAVLQARGYCISNIRHPVWHINNMCIMRDARYNFAIKLALWAMCDEQSSDYSYIDKALESWKIARKKYKNTFWPNLPMREAVSV